jgi:cell cycle checkpoint protein
MTKNTLVLRSSGADGIYQASWLHDAIQELEGSSVERLTIAASPQRPYFSLSAAGPMGSTVVEFSNDKSLLQSFKCDKPVQHTFVTPSRPVPSKGY